MWVSSFHIRPAAYSRPMATVDRNSRPAIDEVWSLRRIAGHSARPTRASHSIRPMNR
jgi:hypothetical protein